MSFPSIVLRRDDADIDDQSAIFDGRLISRGDFQGNPVRPLVKELQLALQTLGFLWVEGDFKPKLEGQSKPTEPTGRFGMATERALRHFQAYAALTGARAAVRVAKPSVAPTVDPTGGGATGGHLKKGRYRVAFAYKTGGGRTAASPEAEFQVNAGQVPRVAGLARPARVEAVEVYVAKLKANGGVERRARYATITDGGATIDLAAVLGSTNAVSALPAGDLRDGEMLTPEPMTAVAKYGGRPTGRFDEPTRKALEGWLVGAGAALAPVPYHCPVVISSFPTNEAELPPGLPPDPAAVNLWDPSTFLVTSKRRMFARDLSGYYSTAPRDLGEYQVLGTNMRFGTRVGPNATSNHAWSKATDASEYRPDTLGFPNGAASAARVATFEVFRAVAEVEPFGYADAVNAYDRAMVSRGPLHWTLLGELGAFLAFLRSRRPEVFRDLFGRFGAEPLRSWTALPGGAAGGDLFERPSRKHIDSRITTDSSELKRLAGLKQPDGPESVEDVPLEPKVERPFIQDWHWYYHFSMAGRTSQPLRALEWDFARIRLRDILRLRWPNATNYPRVGADPQTAAPATLGQTFRSPHTVAMLLRWHVKTTNAFSAGEQTGSRLNAVWNRVKNLGPFAGQFNVLTWSDNAVTAMERERLFAQSLVVGFEAATAEEAANGEPDLTLRELRRGFDVEAAEARHYRMDWPAFATGLTSFARPLPASDNLRLALNGLPLGQWLDLPEQGAIATMIHDQTGVTLTAEARVRRHANRLWYVEHRLLDEGIDPDDELKVATVQRFRLTLASDEATTLDGRELPTLRFTPNFALDATGLTGVVVTGGDVARREVLLPADPFVGELTAPTGPANTIAPARLTVVRDRAGAAWPDVDLTLTPGQVSARVDEDDRRWTILVPEASGGSIRELTVRRVPSDATQLRIDPPGFCLRYGATPLAPGAGPAATEPLRRDLRELGFRGVAETGGFDASVREATRQFQAYASRSRVARKISDATPYARSLASVDVSEAERYRGGISGVVNQETAAVIDHWISKTRRWRCPVVVEARTPNAGAPSTWTPVPDRDNLWMFDPAADATTDRILVTDFSADAPALTPLGVYADDGGAPIRRGPRVRNLPADDAVAAFRPCQAEVTPDRLIADPTSDIQRSTFRVLRAVLEQTCQGFFDGVEATSATALVEAGLWRLRDADEGQGALARIVGGLPAYWSFVRSERPSAFERAIGWSGARPVEFDGKRATDPWHPPGSPSDGNPIHRPESRRYLGGLAYRKGEAGAPPDAYVFSALVADDADQMRGWHWVKRIAESGRDPEFQTRLGTLARRVLELLLRARFAVSQAVVGNRPTREVFQSEKAWAIILHWHARIADDIARKADGVIVAGRALEKAVVLSGVLGDPASWTDAQERSLIAGLLAAATAFHQGTPDAPLIDELQRIARWPDWIAGERNPAGFALDLTQLNRTTGADNQVTRSPADVPSATFGQLDANTVNDEVRAELAAAVNDDEWRTADDLAVEVVRPGAVWRVRRTTAANDHQRFWIRRAGDQVVVTVGLSSRRGSLLPDLRALPPIAAKAAQLAPATVMVQLAPPATTNQLDGRPLTTIQHEYGIALLIDLSTGGPAYEFDTVLLTRRDGSESSDPLVAMPIRLTEPRTVTLAVRDAASGVTGRIAATAATPEAEGLPVFDLDPEQAPPADAEWPLKVEDLVSAGAVGSPRDSSLRLVGLQWTDGRLLGEQARVVLEVAVPFAARGVPLAFASAAERLPGDGSRPSHQFREFTLADDGSVAFAPAYVRPADDDSLPELKLPPGWPLSLPRLFPFGLTGSLGDGRLDGALGGRLDENATTEVPLGSPLAVLDLKGPLDLSIGLVDGLRLARPEAAGPLTAGFGFDLFAQAVGEDKVIGHRLESIGDPTVELGRLLRVGAPEGGMAFAPGASLVRMTGGRPMINAALFGGLTGLAVKETLRNRLFAGKLPGLDNASLVTFKAPEAPEVTFGLNERTGRWRLEAPLQFVCRIDEANPKPIFEAVGRFGFEADVVATDEGDFVSGSCGAFTVDDEVELQVKSSAFEGGVRFGDIISLHVPENTVFRLRTSPDHARLEWDPSLTRRATRQLIAIRAPAAPEGSTTPMNQPEKRRFTFELESFSVGGQGVSFKGNVRAENVDLGIPVFQEPLAVQRPERSAGGAAAEDDDDDESLVGRIEFLNGRLSRCGIQAGFRLHYFDDAHGVIRFLMGEDADRRLTFQGAIEISSLVEYRLRELYALFQITRMHVGATWRSADQSWDADGWMTGSLKFQPPAGESAAPLGPIAKLFAGVTCEFERLDPVNIGGAPLTFRFPARSFDLANVLEVDLSGIRIDPNSGASKSFQLLGDVRIKNLPGIGASLTFGGIELTTGDGPPKFGVRRIGASLSSPGGFEIDAMFEQVRDPNERGFGGSMSVRTEALPPLSGMLKLTEARADQDAEFVPTLVLFFEAPFELPLVFGFFLRSIGLGLGLNQKLIGLDKADAPLTQRLQSFVDRPEGLPEPRVPSSWAPTPPASKKARPNWMLLGRGLVTFGNLSLDATHIIVGDILLAIDERVGIAAAVNIWLFCSPTESRRSDFRANPAARGAIIISPREGKILGYFRTLRSPRMGRETPPLVGEVLGQVETTLMFLADRNGFLVEVGWPWRTKAELSLGGPLRGALTSGFRYGVYRGVTCYALNFAIDVALDGDVQVDFPTPIGSAGGRLAISGQGYFRASLVGALDAALRPALLGDVRVNVAARASIEIHASLSKKITRWFRISIRVNISASANISITASLVAAIEGLAPAFTGDAHAAVGVRGFRLGGQVPFRHHADRVDETRAKLDALLPPAISELAARRAVRAPVHVRETPLAETRWTYRLRLAHVNGVHRYLLAVLPAPGAEFPGINTDPDDWGANPPLRRFSLRLTPAGVAAFRGFHGDPGPDDVTGSHELDAETGLLSWSERVSHVLLSTERILADHRKDEDTAENPNNATEQPFPEPLTIGSLLHGWADAPDVPPSGFGAERELTDPRAARPSAADADDATTDVGPVGPPSPHFRRDQTYDQAVSEACRRPDLPSVDDAHPERDEAKPINGFSTAPLAVEALALFDDPEVAAANRDDGAAARLAARYTLAPHLRMVLVFETREPLPDDQPISALLDELAIQVPVDHKMRRFRGATGRTISELNETVDLVAVADLAGGPRVYQISAGEVFQAESNVSFPIEFNSWPANPENQPEDPEPFFTPYIAGFKHFRIRRVNLTRSECPPLDAPIMPVWLDRGPTARGAVDPTPRYVRPPFQFVDDQVGRDGTRENDFLSYTIDAIGEEDPERPLASTSFVVQRRTARVEEPPGPLLVMHRPTPRVTAGANGPTLDDAGDIEFVVGLPGLGDLDPDDADERNRERAVRVAALRFRVRRVDRRVVGPYGFESDPPARTLPKSALPRHSLPIPPDHAGAGDVAADVIPDVRFRASDQARPIPWDQTNPLPLDLEWTWLQAVVETTPDARTDSLNDDEPERKLIGLRGHMPAGDFWAAVHRATNTAPDDPDAAFEVWVGSETVAGESAAASRTVLTQGRHALWLAGVDSSASRRELADEPATAPRDVFARGNALAALEPLRPRASRPVERWFLDPRAIGATVDYEYAAPGVRVAAARAARRDDSSWPIGVALRLVAQLPSPLDGPLGEPGPGPDERLDPVVGLRLHRLDRLDPRRYALVPGGVAAAVEVDALVAPFGYYASTPPTIELRPLTLRDETSGAAVIRADWRATHAQPDGEPFVLYEPVARAVGTVEPGRAVAGFPFVDVDGDQPGETLLLDEVLAFLGHMVQVLRLHAPRFRDVDLGFVVQVREPLVDRADPLATTSYPASVPEAAGRHADRFATAFAAFRDAFAATTDPYAWGIAEALGLSCEAMLVDRGDQSPVGVDAELLETLRRNWGEDGPRPALDLALFVADDGVSHLNVMRILRVGAIPEFVKGAPAFDLRLPLLMRLLGRYPYSSRQLDPTFPRLEIDALDAHGEAIYASLNAWRAEWLGRLTESVRAPGETGRPPAAAGGHVLAYRRQPIESEPGAGASGPRVLAARRSLPFDGDGLVRLDLPAPDRLAHLYHVAAEAARRYDEVWTRLLDLLPEDHRRPEGHRRPDWIPHARIAEFPVDRTEPLLPHNALATPLPGSVRAHVFAHPSEFASNASAEREASLQYSGRTVMLERRIAERTRRRNIYDGPGFAEVSWARYQLFLEAGGYDEPASGPPRPPLALGVDPPGSLALDPVVGTRSAIYGADTFVAPDVPPDYEYRFVAFSTAGRARSPHAATGFVAPQFDEPPRPEPGSTVDRPPRMRPRIEGYGDVSYDAEARVLRLDVRLVHSRLHMRPEVARLWIGADDVLEVGTGRDRTPIRFGGLPDLQATYAIYQRLNLDAGPGEPIGLTPLISIRPPIDPEVADSVADHLRRFHARSGDANVHFGLDRDGKPILETDLLVCQRPDDAMPAERRNELYLRLDLHVEGAEHFRGQIARAIDMNRLDLLFEVAAWRGGAKSLSTPIQLLNHGGDAFTSGSRRP